MTRKKSKPASGANTLPHGTGVVAEGLDREIALLRDLIRKAGEKQTDKLDLEDQLDLLETVGRTAPALARLLKARRDLANEELDPAALLRQALIELEEEWPELKKFAESTRK